MSQPPGHRGRKVIGGLSPARSTDTARAPQADDKAAFLVGHGYDIHRIQTGGKMLLSGVVVSDQMSPIAHSDGDVVIHALVDALLGAMGWGDIGQMFSDADDQWKGAASRVFLETVYAKVRSAGYRLGNADVTILAERPRLAPFKVAMTESLRELFQRDGSINLKAGTNEGCDAVGRGDAIAAHAVVLLAQGR
jgi:2-C-methyl-D-erythritol 2,4-cyclodiphosphate synthase